ncbi:cell division protein ZipA [Aliidiomarina iranensis]|uniref:Cell division protein ZipA n=1 Tax=Aliidiomarina iranensis TaxID=1434071 RepID=A0A432W0X6_9GAMM|nr:cell division protein ZipA [Aliidiomarina iranensis]RUO22643.1 cell division protein ZipA [Aliidiomarina iranensis]
MDSFRIVLIIVGVVLIAGLVIHGVWTLRKNNQAGEKKRESVQRKRQQYENSQNDLLANTTDSESSASSDSFDELGLGRVKARKVSESGASAKRASDAGIGNERSEASAKVTAKPQQAWGDDDTEVEPGHRSLAAVRGVRTGTGSVSEQAKEDTGESFGDNPMQAATTPEADPELPSVRAKRDDGEVEQLPIDLASAEENEEVEPPQEEVITLFVSGDIKGTSLLETVTELGMKFGELDIFHRYEQPSGRGPLLFRMANMYNPGTFNLDDFSNFNTRGVVLFMTLPLKYDGHKAFTMMYNAANKIADAMPRAAVLDGNRNPMTKQSVQHTYQKIREFERRMRLAGLRQDY